MQLHQLGSLEKLRYSAKLSTVFVTSTCDWSKGFLEADGWNQPADSVENQQLTQREEERVFSIKYLVWETLNKAPGSHSDEKLELYCTAGKIS